MSLKLINELSLHLKPVNHILYEIIIFISLYFVLNTLNKRSSYQTLLTKNTKSFMILICLFAVLLDWLIWNDCTKSVLFAAVLCIYVYYNFTNIKNIANFMNILDASYISSDDTTDIEMKNIENARIRELTLVPNEIKNYIAPPQPFDKQELSINDYNDAYNFDEKTYKRLIDNEYAQTILNKLHESSKYKQTYLESDINYPTNKMINSLENNESINKDELLKSFQNPKRVFLDNTWLQKRTYNDNCVTCKDKSSCNIVEFGKKLEKCTDDHGNITEIQLEKISTNQVEPIYKSF